MPDGKLHIKGTITIKGGKTTKRKRKPRKKKSGLADTGGYTGTGKAETRQEFSTPYTAQALMTAMALRPPPPQVTYMEQPQQKPSLDQSYKFQELLDNPNVPFDAPVITTKKELYLKAEPFLKKEIQQNVQQYRQSLEEDTRAYEQRAMEAEQQAEERILGMRQELEQRQQFFENELEQSRDNYIAELGRMEMEAENEKKRMQLENIRDKAKFMTESVLDKTLFNIESQQQKKQLEQQKQEIEQTRQEMTQQGLRNRVETIRGMATKPLEQAISRIEPGYTFTAEEGKTKVDVLRDKLIELEGLTDIANEMGAKVQLKRGRRPKEAAEQVLEPAQLSANDLLMQRMREKLQQAEEEQLNSDWLGFMSKKEQAEQRLDKFLEFVSKQEQKTLEQEREPSINRALPNYLRTPYGVMTEQRARQEFRNIPRSKGRQAEALDLAGAEFFIQPKKRDFAV